MRSAVAEALRHETDGSHRRVEATLDLLDPDLDRYRLRSVLVRLAGFWRTAEAGVQRWADVEPELAVALDWPRRRRSDRFAADAVSLGAAPEDLVAPVPSDVVGAGVLGAGVPTTADVLGWGYVAEGSTLGGAVIGRQLAARGLELTAFTPYPEGPGPMWQAYHRVLAEWVDAATDRGAAVVAAAVAVFAALEQWCEPAPVVL